MADVTKLAALLGAYGIGVRAGTITPCVEDEIYLRGIIGLPDMPEHVRTSWAETKNVRHPITLASDIPESENQP